MGLDTTHDAWHGSYSTFGEWRAHVARAAGFPPLSEMLGFGGKRSWDTVSKNSRLVPLLNHSDCDGELTPTECAGIAEALGELIDRMPDYMPDYQDAPRSYWRDKTRSFIAGCRAAAVANEPLKFR
jgi:hypothetical protein